MMLDQEHAVYHQWTNSEITIVSGPEEVSPSSHTGGKFKGTFWDSGLLGSGTYRFDLRES